MENTKKRISLRTSLIISVSLVHAILMGLFVYHNTRESRELISEEMKGSARSFARMLATTATNAILSKDIGSLHEYVDKTARENNVSYAIIEDGEGAVLASTGRKFDGYVLTDEVSKRANISDKELHQEAGNVFDVAVPIFMAGKKIGIARVGVSTEGMIQKITAARVSGIKMTLLAVIVGSIVAVFIALRMAKGLTALGNAAGEMTGGNLNTRAQVDSYMEVNGLAYAFNQMADAIQEREEELQQSMEELDNAHEELQSANEELQQNYEELEHTNEELQSTTEELQTTNEELSWANEKVMEADRLKSEFLANMSHELRTPLNSILVLSDILLARMDGDLTEEQDKQVRIIQKSGKNLLELINDILDLSKIEAGRMEMHVGEFHIGDVIADARTTVAPLASEKGISLAVAAGNVPAIRSDRNKVKQILLNLLSNAVKFTPRGGSVTIGAGHGDGVVRLSVADTGIGIAKENLGKIFEEFRQLDGTSTREYGGTGLGLAITKRLAGMLGGDIGVESELGKGSTFTITIPVRMPVEAIGIKGVAVEVDADRKTILAVDDDPSAVYILKKFLESEGYQVIPCHGGEEALRLAKEFNPLAVTLDIMMPGKDGWEVIRELKGDPLTEHIPIVVVSILENRDIAFSLGVTEYLTKPVEKEMVLNAVERLLPMECKGMNCKANILLVDDDPVHIMAMRAVLEGNGYEAMAAPGGREAIEMLKETTPCVIILDIMMPEVDGFKVLEELKKREDTRGIPVIILTAKDITDEDRKRLNGNIEGLVNKGLFAREEVLRDLKSLLERRNTG